MDAGGAVVPNAPVVVVNEGNGLTRTVTSNGDGNYVVTDLPVGVLYGVDYGFGF